MPKDKSLNPSKVYKERKKHDRFNGMPEEEVSKRTLPDHLTNNLDIVIVSIFMRICIYFKIDCLKKNLIYYHVSKTYSESSFFYTVHYVSSNNHFLNFTHILYLELNNKN